MLCGSAGSKSWLAKATGVEPSGQLRNEKFHAVVAQQISKSKTGSEPKMTCSKSAQGCGATHMEGKSAAKRTTFGALSEIVMSKKVYTIAAQTTCLR